MPPATPIVFVVDDDISMRESLEAMIRFAGWQPETFASAQEFIASAEPGYSSAAENSWTAKPNSLSKSGSD